jgi:SPW repeat
MRSLRKNAILEVYQLVLAVFLFVSPWLFAFAHGTLRVDTWVSAALVTVISFVALIAFREWEEWLNCILGLWIAMSPWVLGFQHTGAMFVNLAIGILIAYLAMLELWLTHYELPSGRRYERSHTRSNDGTSKTNVRVGS